ncbi:hypothetical protein [Clostridium saccharoperbutylacetonicum]|uniref:hypothetical protein n=2 Tax=Clostridium TaxID=1485 RepID=UPI0009845DA4|nr:hypothetical protein [Clostridium saccharoperbutylacetonicum]NSB30159.1 hypothetical protein [Clostridium saccharoperbutylacetonicum]
MLYKKNIYFDYIIFGFIFIKRHIIVMILEKAGIDAIEVSGGNGSSSEPDLIKRWENGNREKPRCISCNKCFNPNGIRCIYK